VNNLKDVSVELPKRRLTVFTGISGSGKSSQVFGSIAAEWFGSALLATKVGCIPELMDVAEREERSGSPVGVEVVGPGDTGPEVGRGHGLSHNGPQGERSGPDLEREVLRIVDRRPRAHLGARLGDRHRHDQGLWPVLLSRFGAYASRPGSTWRVIARAAARSSSASVNSRARPKMTALR
jgi:hypothetical protein